MCVLPIYTTMYTCKAVPQALSHLSTFLYSESCNGSSQFPSDGSSCSPGDQKWQRFFPSVNLTAFAPGNYVLEVYFDMQTNNSQPAPAACNSSLLINNSNNNYKASFSIQSPNLSSTNPSSCFGNEGSITIGGLVAGASYQLSYTDDGTPVGPNTYVANGSGQVVITGLNKGFYSNFSLQINGCTTNFLPGSFYRTQYMFRHLTRSLRFAQELLRQHCQPLQKTGFMEAGTLQQ